MGRKRHGLQENCLRVRNHAMGSFKGTPELEACVLEVSNCIGMSMMFD